MNRLAIIDWGIGGFGFWKEWHKLRPQENAVYFSDSGFTPYGKVPGDELAARLSEIMTALRESHGVSHGVIACHSASTVISQLDCPGVTIAGVVEATASLIRETIPAGPVTLVGGQRTIASGTYPPLLPDHEVTGLIAQPLSATVEAGRLDGREIETLVLETLKDTTPDLVLACTHYVALTPVIARTFPGLRLHDPIPSLARNLAQSWPAMSGGPAFMTSGSPEEMRTGAKAAFGIELPEGVAESSRLWNPDAQSLRRPVDRLAVHESPQIDANHPISEES